ncbi:hypothetical protein FIBSPDRAFT_867902 [Athelia psychrophila]|uniref:Uncharacterized protein n=1 Tax=Athelia psychrophila TaxID=1759441 RepID=A0A166DJ66_9AGAM|nr:hypothetical protein FIBSPDRAFT_867902 [Fibularhizoctonia sp. CBS 109695]
MLLFTPTNTLTLRLALIMALFSYGASAAPHSHTKRCNDVMYEPCYAAADCCAFSYCQSTVMDNGTAVGACFPGFSEKPYTKIVTPATALAIPTPAKTGYKPPGSSGCADLPWYDRIYGC